MTVEHLEVIVEEESAEAALRVLLPKLIGGTSFRILTHQGKSDLVGCLPERLRGYAGWLPAGWRIVVVVDRDADDCHRLKADLDAIARDAGLRPRGRSTHWTVVNRIACEELEAWYFGDWDAVRAAYPRVSAGIPTKARFREPDAIRGGTWEAFERIVQDAGYFTGGLRKIEAARAIAAHMDPARNRSRSFQVLTEALTSMAESP